MNIPKQLADCRTAQYWTFSNKNARDSRKIPFRNPPPPGNDGPISKPIMKQATTIVYGLYC